MPNIPPPNSSPGKPSPEIEKKQSELPPSPLKTNAQSMGMSEFMALFTPEERKKFMDILVKNLSNEIQKSSKKYIEELKRQRSEMS